MSNYAKTRERLQQLAESDNKNASRIAEKHYRSGISQQPVAQMNEFLAEASQDEQFLSEFNETLKLQKNEIKAYSDKKIRAQIKSLHPEYKAEDINKALETFATTGSDTSGTNVAIDPILPTNILDVDQYLFAEDGSILSQVTRMSEKGEVQMPEFDVAPIPQNGAELTALTEKEFKRRDGEDYKLNSNKKFGILTKVTELGLRKGSAAYFATIRRDMVRGIENELVKQIFRGTDAGSQMHGFFTDRGNAAELRGSFDITSDANIAAETNKFRKLVLALGTLPSDLKDSEFRDYTMITTRNTWYSDIVPSLDGENRYYLEAIMNGLPTLVGPGGLRVQFVSENAIDRGTVAIVPLNKYILNMPQGIELKDDGGFVNFATGQVLMKATCYADGGFVNNFKRTSGWTTGADDNRDRNYFRYITGLNA